MDEKNNQLRPKGEEYELRKHGGKRAGAGAKPKTDTRKLRGTPRWTDAEWSQVIKDAEAAGATISDHIRNRVLL
jgi:hypothetical protein